MNWTNQVRMREETLRDQAGMEQAFQDYFTSVQASCSGTLNAMLNVRLQSCDREKRTVILRAEPAPWMANPGGILHGGIISAYLDLAMGLLCRYYNGGQMTPTLHVDVNFLRTGSLADALCIRAEITKPGASIFYTVGEIYPESKPDKLLATASGSYFSAKH